MNEKNRINLSGAVVLCAAVLTASLAMDHTAEAQMKPVPKEEKHRVIVLTDIGGDPDDMQSMTRLLMYADQYDIEGLLATSIRIFPGSKTRPPDGEPQPQYTIERVKAYGEVRQNLLKHSEGWPETNALLQMIKRGTKTGRSGGFDIKNGTLRKPGAHLPIKQVIGEGKDTEASNHIIRVVNRDDPRPVWISVWGGSIDLAQALWRVRNDRSTQEVKRFVNKLRVYAWGHQDLGGPWIQENFPGVFYIASTGGILYSADPSLSDRKWLDTHVRFNHGPLGALCPLRRDKLGGADSETFLGLIPNGLSAMEHPSWGGWGGRLKLAPGSKTHWIDILDKGATICRWAPHFQNDYQARMDWCVREFDEANHPPRPVLNGDKSLQPLEIAAMPGYNVALDAAGSDDIDGDTTLSYEWRYYPEAGTYPGEIDIENANRMNTGLVVPEDASGTVLHIVLVVTDNGAPPLTRYRRLVIQCK